MQRLGNQEKIMQIKTFGAAIILFLSAIVAPATDKPLSLHPENPHYFLFRGKPTILLTSGEHYGAVLNVDFDYLPYLDDCRPSILRTFSGTYREDPSAFGIVDNTQAPKRFLSPWMRDAGKFDLKRYDPAYFARLKDFVAQAGKRGVVVELSLFCAFTTTSCGNSVP